jgi:hypothetical protein
MTKKWLGYKRESSDGRPLHWSFEVTRQLGLKLEASPHVVMRAAAI